MVSFLKKIQRHCVHIDFGAFKVVAVNDVRPNEADNNHKSRHHADLAGYLITGPRSFGGNGLLLRFEKDVGSTEHADVQGPVKRNLERWSADALFLERGGNLTLAVKLSAIYFSSARSGLPSLPRR